MASLGGGFALFVVAISLPVFALWLRVVARRYERWHYGGRRGVKPGLGVALGVSVVPPMLALGISLWRLASAGILLAGQPVLPFWGYLLVCAIPFGLLAGALWFAAWMNDRAMRASKWG